MNIIDAKRKALEGLIQRVLSGTATGYDLSNYDKLKKLGIIK